MRTWGVAALGAAVLAGCAQAPGDDAPQAETTSPPPSSVACPQVEGVQLPPECVPYDPQALMDANHDYADRYPVSELAFAAFEQARPGIEAAVARLQASGSVTVDSVARTLEDAGLGASRIEPVVTWENIDGIKFMAGGPAAGCVEGSVTVDSFEMHIMGYIHDGGCIPAVGH